jgi:hypothetical protein
MGRMDHHFKNIMAEIGGVLKMMKDEVKANTIVMRREVKRSRR